MDSKDFLRGFAGLNCFWAWKPSFPISLFPCRGLVYKKRPQRAKWYFLWGFKNPIAFNCTLLNTFYAWKKELGRIICSKLSLKLRRRINWFWGKYVFRPKLFFNLIFIMNAYWYTFSNLTKKVLYNYRLHLHDWYKTVASGERGFVFNRFGISFVDLITGEKSLKTTNLNWDVR